MLAFTASELSDMQSAQDAAMQDTCVLHRRVITDGEDAYGAPVIGEESATTICGLDLRASREWANGERPVYDARLRLPIATDITSLDWVEITHRFGVQIMPALRFDVSGNPRRGPSGLVLELRSRT